MNNKDKINRLINYSNRPMKDTHTRSTFLVKKELLKRLNKLAQNKHGFKTDFINYAIEQALFDLEEGRQDDKEEIHLEQGYSEDRVRNEISSEVETSEEDIPLQDNMKKKALRENREVVVCFIDADIADVLDMLSKEGGRGAKSDIVNQILRSYFEEVGLIK